MRLLQQISHAGRWAHLQTAAAGVLCLALVASCATAPELTPAPAARTAPGSKDTAVAQRQGIKLLVEADAWTGRTEVRNHVTPLRVTIQNNSGKDLRVRYDDFDLVSNEGQVHSALPPFAIEGGINEPVAVSSLPPISSPAFAHSGYQVAPYYSPLYPGLTPYAGSFPYDPVYYDYYHSYWVRIPLPTEEMLQQVLPEGVLQAGGQVSGFLYFEPITEKDQQLVFRADLVQAQSGEVFGTVEIPFVTER